MGAKSSNSRAGQKLLPKTFDLPWDGLGHMLLIGVENLILYRAESLKYWHDPTFLALPLSLAQTVIHGWQSYA
jgi:hypothetical protein